MNHALDGVCIPHGNRHFLWSIFGHVPGMSAVDLLNVIRKGPHAVMRRLATVNVATYYYYSPFSITMSSVIKRS